VIKLVLLQDLKGVDVLPGVDNVQVKILLRGHVLRGDEAHDIPDDIHIVIVEQDIWFLLDDTRKYTSITETTRSFGVNFHRIVKLYSWVNETVLNILTLIILESVVDNFNTRERRQVVHEFVRDTSVPSPLITVGAHKENLHTPNKANPILKP